ncbi:aspartate aminotransferase family protein [Thermodesulforhabdus norvegica]|uniref:Acetylornithine aminotransferase n=1 Tax=Thermodesulforhabdus norvegica TaxID=39841 RepID=A0A1I4W635_9BACT|nr:aspartate aminotransferase family protein [Thermodesulforhabdus norvegica]SFN08720.1 acetylornithine aminotransferase apoenzyme [Thermodesulforhabdus norvegica]
MRSPIQQLADSVICNTYVREEVTFVRGSGCRLWDEKGNEYRDFVAGIAVCNLGHCPENVAKAICDQARKLVHVSNLYYTEPQVELAAELVKRSFADRVFFCNSGAEANEAAIKLARKYSRDRFGPGRFHVITMKNSFHGRTLATLSATGQEKVHKGFEPLVDGFVYVDFDSIEAVEAAVTDKTCAVMVEPIQGEGGVRIPSPGYLKGLRELCNEKKLLLIFDEVQVGMGRTGSLFAYEQEEVEPDIMTLAKALANGLPMGAMLAREDVASSFGPGSHASTFGGTPLVAAAALETVRTIAQRTFLDRVKTMGRYFLDKLKKLEQKYTFVKDVRGRGLMVAMELDIPGAPIVKSCLEKGALINCVQEKILRFTPPLIVEREEIDWLVEILDGVFKEQA